LSIYINISGSNICHNVKKSKTKRGEKIQVFLNFDIRILLLAITAFGLVFSLSATKSLEGLESNLLYSNISPDAKVDKANSTSELNDPSEMYKKVSLQTSENNGVDNSEMISAIKAAENRIVNTTLYLPISGPWKALSGTLNSSTEIHTDINAKHDMILVLPDTGKLYEGVLTYSATTDVQPVSFMGPVSLTDKKGQLIASMDGGINWYAVSTKESDQSLGTWQFAGNAIAVHTDSETPFIGNYTVVYRELNPSETNKMKTITSTPSQVIGNNTGQVSWIIPPSQENHTGTLSFSSSDNIQFLTFHGPLKSSEEKDKKMIWSPDNGKTTHEITLTDLGNKEGLLTPGKMGTFTFGGNGLAIYAPGEKPVTTSYALVTH
jgi:hypothetical protein